MTLLNKKKGGDLTGNMVGKCANNFATYIFCAIKELKIAEKSGLGRIMNISKLFLEFC
jgi:hypothetical protein